MSYPQPDSDEYAIKGGQFFRLMTPLTSPGDIYESQQSAHGFALGPQSDVSNVVVAYFDEQVQSFVSVSGIGPRRSLTGRVVAQNDARYAPSGRPGRIFLFPADLYDPSYQPAGFVPGSQTLTFITPVLDVIQYFSPPESLVPQRDDKTFRFDGIPNDGAQGWIVIPFWGRKTATIRFDNFCTNPVNFGVRGVTYYVNDPSINPPNTPTAIERQILGSGAIASGAHADLLITPSGPADPGVFPVGAFDALAFLISFGGTPADGPTPLEVTVSDDL